MVSTDSEKKRQAGSGLDVLSSPQHMQVWEEASQLDAQ